MNVIVTHCARCGYLWVRNANASHEGHTHHSGDYEVTGDPKWCTGRERVASTGAVVSAYLIGGHQAAQALLDAGRNFILPRRRDRRFSVYYYRGDIRGWSVSNVYSGSAGRLLVDDPHQAKPAATKAQVEAALAWYTTVLPSSFKPTAMVSTRISDATAGALLQRKHNR